MPITDPADKMLVVACYFHDGKGEFTDDLTQRMAQKIAGMLTGEFGPLYFIWSTDPATLPWYEVRGCPFKCKARAGKVLRWYHSPDDATPYKTTADGREMQVLRVKPGTGWLMVLDTPYQIWVKAEDCDPV